MEFFKIFHCLVYWIKWKDVRFFWPIRLLVYDLFLLNTHLQNARSPNIYTDYNSVGFLGQTTQFQSHVFLQLLCNVHRPKMNVLPKTISQCLKSKYIKQCDLKATNRGNAILSKWVYFASWQKKVSTNRQTDSCTDRLKSQVIIDHELG